jgi:hypothetical protein
VRHLYRPAAGSGCASGAHYLSAQRNNSQQGEFLIYQLVAVLVRHSEFLVIQLSDGQT